MSFHSTELVTLTMDWAAKACHGNLSSPKMLSEKEQGVTLKTRASTWLEAGTTTLLQKSAHLFNRVEGLDYGLSS